MNPLESESEALVLNTISDFQERLNEILRTNQITHDYALLSGYLTFVHSKLMKMIETNLIKQKQLYRQYKEYPSEMTEAFDKQTAVLILDALWGKIYYPIFKWFQNLRNFIVPRKAGEQPKYFEFRKMSSKIAKFYKEVQTFLTGIINYIFLDPEIETTDGVPPQVFVFFNLKKKPPKALPKKLILSLKYNDPLAAIVRLVLHRCTLYLGSAQRYKIMNEKISNRHSVEDFVKSTEYFDLASLLLPSSGETYLQRGMVYIQTDNLGMAVEEFIKSALAKSPCPAALSNFKTIILENDSTLHLRLDKLILDVHSQDLKGTKIVNREIIELYFVALFGSYFAPDIWCNPMKPIYLRNGLAIKTLELTLFEKIASRYIKNIETIYNDLIVAIGGFNLLLLFNSMGNNSRLNMVKPFALTRNQSSYLGFVFTYITRVLNDVIKEAWNSNHETHLYLAMLRIIGCWIFANETVLEFAKSNVAFCQTYAALLNDILASGLVSPPTSSNSKPKRSYLFEEDIQLKELTFIGDELDDFNDTKIHTSEDCMIRLVGKPPMEDKLSPKEEKLARLEAVLLTGKQILSYNKCDIKFNTENQRYDILNVVVQETKPKIVEGKNKSNKQNKSNKMNLSKDYVDIRQTGKDRSYASQSNEYANKNSSLEQDSSKVYSGTSVKPPESFDIKPSFQLKPSESELLAGEFNNISISSPVNATAIPQLYSLHNEDESLPNGNGLATDSNNNFNSEDNHMKYLSEIFRPSMSMSSLGSSRRNSSLKGYLPSVGSANIMSSTDRSVTSTPTMDNHRNSYGYAGWPNLAEKHRPQNSIGNSSSATASNGVSGYYDSMNHLVNYPSRLSVTSDTTILPEAHSPFSQQLQSSYGEPRVNDNEAHYMQNLYQQQSQLQQQQQQQQQQPQQQRPNNQMKTHNQFQQQQNLQQTQYQQQILLKQQQDHHHRIVNQSYQQPMVNSVGNSITMQNAYNTNEINPSAHNYQTNIAFHPQQGYQNNSNVNYPPGNNSQQSIENQQNRVSPAGNVYWANQHLDNGGSNSFYAQYPYSVPSSEASMGGTFVNTGFNNASRPPPQ
ncbi:Ebs1p [Nakaseomyces bracarensis]|uniref:Ebs1p n=1 Tax=Nakaseomyces bracarensis TaxID=273131 RepID=UPI0038711E87